MTDTERALRAILTQAQHVAPWDESQFERWVEQLRAALARAPAPEAVPQESVTIIRELLRTEGWRSCGFGTDNRLRYNEARRRAAEYMNGVTRAPVPDARPEEPDT